MTIPGPGRASCTATGNSVHVGLHRLSQIDREGTPSVPCHGYGGADEQSTYIIVVLPSIMSDHTHQPHENASAPAHTHTHGHDFTSANKAYFDEHADKLEEMHPEWREMARKEVEAMRNEWPELLNKERTVVLDFACGTGM